tara:strand:- start:704 stop:1792 length:1089 start_codon:yes stop_codon:yes gene_type:complete
MALRRLRALFLLLATALGTSWLATQMRERGIIVARTGKVWLERPLLVIGMPGTGTSQMTESLAGLGFDVTHESSYGQDGTVSWLHGARYLPGEPDTATLCRKPVPGVEFHFAMMLEPHQCGGSCRTGCWDYCWERTCPRVLRRQYGCHLPGADRRRCASPYRTTLLQVRHPLRSISSAVRGFCARGLHVRGEARQVGLPNATAGPMVLRLRDFVPPQLWRAAATEGEAEAEAAAQAEPPSCAATLARLWLIYYTVVSREVDGWYRVEDTDACAVARAARMTTDCTSRGGEVFLRNRSDSQIAVTGTEALAARTLRAGQHKYRAHKNLDGLSLTYDDIARAHGGPHIAAGLRVLAQKFGYPDV